MTAITHWHFVCNPQARKYPVYCPNPECDEELAAADVAHLLTTQPELLQVCWASVSHTAVLTPPRACSLTLPPSNRAGCMLHTMLTSAGTLC
jgi:hypothetical protein